MRIRELGCDESIVLSKFKFNCDEIDKSIPDPLPQNLNHFLMIVGKPGSSKTTLLLNLICKRGKMYNKKFDRVYLFSPSLGTIEDCPFEKLAKRIKVPFLFFKIDFDKKLIWVRWVDVFEGYFRCGFGFLAPTATAGIS